MELDLKPGEGATETVLVDRERTIGFMGEAGRVYSTPSMVSDVEYACLRLIQKHLPEGQSSVGGHVAVDHLAPTPLGARVRISVTVTAVDGRRVTLDARVHDAIELVGSGTHVRHVVDIARQIRRIEDKSRRLAEGDV